MSLRKARPGGQASVWEEEGSCGHSGELQVPCGWVRAKLWERRILEETHGLGPSKGRRPWQRAWGFARGETLEVENAASAGMTCSTANPPGPWSTWETFPAPDCHGAPLGQMPQWPPCNDGRANSQHVPVRSLSPQLLARLLHNVMPHS